jgi:hypothetical protein
MQGYWKNPTTAKNSARNRKTMLEYKQKSQIIFIFIPRTINSIENMLGFTHNVFIHTLFFKLSHPFWTMP